jgi:predicted FMN-binding regulatory protein PaiB
MQPEGGHAPIDATDPRYTASLRGVSVLRLDTLEITGKFKFGQNMPETRRDKIVDGLSERGLPDDANTIKHIRDSALKCPMKNG